MYDMMRDLGTKQSGLINRKADSFAGQWLTKCPTNNAWAAGSRRRNCVSLTVFAGSCTYWPTSCKHWTICKEKHLALSNVVRSPFATSSPISPGFQGACTNKLSLRWQMCVDKLNAYWCVVSCSGYNKQFFFRKRPFPFFCTTCYSCH